MNRSPARKSSTSVGRIGERVVNGTERPMTVRMRSGRHSVVFHATGAPQSWPAITAVGLERVEETDDVTDEVQLRVSVDRFGASVCP